MFEIHPTIIIVTIDIIIITIVIIKPKDHLEIYFPEIKKKNCISDPVEHPWWSFFVKISDD